MEEKVKQFLYDTQNVSLSLSAPHSIEKDKTKKMPKKTSIQNEQREQIIAPVLLLSRKNFMVTIITGLFPHET